MQHQHIQADLDLRDELEEDVHEECQKFGQVDSVKVCFLTSRSRVPSELTAGL